MTDIEKFVASVTKLLAAYATAKAEIATLTTTCSNHDALIASQLAMIDSLNKAIADQQALMDAAVITA